MPADAKLITISNAHPRGFAFGITEDGDQVFIPPHVVGDRVLVQGHVMQIQVVTNPDKHHRDRTAWIGVAFKEEEDGDNDVVSFNDERVYNLICESHYLTAGDIAEVLDMEPVEARASAVRLFRDNRIAKADVYNRVGQPRESFTLWAENALDFLQEEEL